MKELLVAAAAAMMTVAAWAGDSGRDAAAKICDGLFKPADKLKCIAIVEKAKGFEENAVKICDGLFKPEDKIACLGACADKKYLAKTIELCEGLFKPEDKIKCLTDSGQKPAVGLAKDEREETILDIERVIRNLENDEVTKALRRLKALRDRLDKKD